MKSGSEYKIGNLSDDEILDIREDAVREMKELRDVGLTRSIKYSFLTGFRNELDLFLVERGLMTS